MGEPGDNRRHQLSRRRVLGAGATAGAGLAAQGAFGAPLAVAKRRARAKRVDVAIVGAGLAGLAAARELKRAGVSFVVLEARRRVGGRTLNQTLEGGEVVEIGGQWVGPTQDRVLALIDELGLDTFKTYVDGKNVYFRSDAAIKRQTYTGTIPPANPASLVELLKVINDLDSMAQQVPAEAPWKATRASEWDGQSFETWKLANTTLQETRDLVDLAIESVFSAEPRDLSLLHVLFYIRAAGTFNHLIDTAGGAQDSRIVGGSQLIAIRLAKSLGRGAVELGSPVERVRWGGGSVTLTTRRGRWKAKRAIITLPPTLAGRLTYRPGLPANRDQITQRLPMGTVYKCMAVYEKPFWREQGLSGMATSDTGEVKLTFDNTPPSGSPGVLLGFIEGQDGRDLADSTQDQRQALVVESLARYYGEQALQPIEYLDKSWAEDRWTRGCYAGFAPPGVITGYREALREPVGPLHWAGTETATVWNGYMDGAIESGQRAAAEVLDRL